MNGKLTPSPASYRLAVTSRVLAAGFGGYLVSALANVSLTVWLPLGRAVAVVTGIILSFLVYLGALLWCFPCRTAWSAWVALLMLSGLALALLLPYRPSLALAFGGLSRLDSPLAVWALG